MNPRCVAIAEGTGKRCNRAAVVGEYCDRHCPKGNVVALKPLRACGDLGKELKALRNRLYELVERVESRAISGSAASNQVAALKAAASIISIERQVKEDEELAARLEDLEAVLLDKRSVA